VIEDEDERLAAPYGLLAALMAFIAKNASLDEAALDVAATARIARRHKLSEWLASWGAPLEPMARVESEPTDVALDRNEVTARKAKAERAQDIRGVVTVANRGGECRVTRFAPPPPSLAMLARALEGLPTSPIARGSACGSGQERSRTADAQIFSLALYHLSYLA
jgi:hypothetical protein